METKKTIDSCFIMPVLPHKIGNVRDFWDDISEEYRSNIEDQLKGVGIKRLLVFLQSMPDKGDFMVFYMQSRNSLERTLSELFTTSMKCSKYMTDSFKDFTGMDMSKKENIPRIELLGEWTEKYETLEEKDMLRMPWSYAIPIKKGKGEEIKKIAAETMWSKGAEIEKMMREHDVVKKVTFLQHNPEGDFAVAHVLTSHPLDELILSVKSCKSEICDIARKYMKEYTDVDYLDPKNVPKVELLVKWDEKNGFKTSEQIIAYTE